MLPVNLITPDRDIIQLALFVDVEPISYTEACKHEVWKKYMEEEIEVIARNQTWSLVAFPASKKPIVVK